MNNRKIFTSESVTQGHPDKLCDLVSDSVLDAVLEQDPMGRVACETAATTGMVLVMGEITTSARIDIAQIARKAICDAGYDRPEMGFDGHSCNVMVAMGRQSPDIAMGVDNAYDDGTTGAGDQGMMFGFACTQTKELMPAPIAYAHNLTRALTAARESGKLPWLRPDGKSQVSVEYGPDGMPARIDTVVVSTQHAPEWSDGNKMKPEFVEAVVENIIRPVMPAEWLKNTRFLVNPTGRFVVGGPQGDCGLTGRKIIVDTYGGACPHGGGAFSGKDPTKVDRSAAYACRYVAKNLVAAGLATRAQIQVSYAIGVADPMNITVNTYGTGVISDERISEIVSDRKIFDLRPGGIIQMLDLRRPIYSKTAAYGHFGREEPEFTWEKTDKVEALRTAAGL